jgi:hypothetical protein
VKVQFASLLLAFAAVSACQGSVEGQVNTGGEETADFNKPLDSQLTAQQVTTDSQGLALLGARQDLSFRGPATATCKCLVVATGQPGDPKFQWNGAKPVIAADSQLVLALSSAGIDCPEAGANAPGASYWGYQIVGNDVVVVVEAASPKYPLAAGGIIPRPKSGGQVYVKPVDKALPYGKAANGTGDRCQVGQVVNLDSPAPAAFDAPRVVTPIPAPTTVSDPVTPPSGDVSGKASGKVTKGIKPLKP